MSVPFSEINLQDSLTVPQTASAIGPMFSGFLQTVRACALQLHRITFTEALRQGAYNGLNGVYGLAGWKCKKYHDRPPDSSTRSFLSVQGFLSLMVSSPFQLHSWGFLSCPVRALLSSSYPCLPVDPSRSPVEHSLKCHLHPTSHRNRQEADGRDRKTTPSRVHQEQGPWVLHHVAYLVLDTA